MNHTQLEEFKEWLSTHPEAPHYAEMHGLLEELTRVTHPNKMKATKEAIDKMFEEKGYSE